MIEDMNRQQIIEALNHSLAAELSAVEMYSAHAEAIGEPDIAQGVAAILDVERGHARALTARIEQLGGQPALPGGEATVAGRVAGAASSHDRTADMLRLELAEEQQAIRDYAGYIASITDDEDTTVSMLEENLRDEMEHARWMRVKIRELERRAV